MNEHLHTGEQYGEHLQEVCERHRGRPLEEQRIQGFTTQKPDEGSEGWPMVTMCRSQFGGPVNLFGGDPKKFDLSREFETYHPASAPNVLSEEEARLLVDALGPLPVLQERDDRAVMAVLFHRLKAYAVKGEPK